MSEEILFCEISGFSFRWFTIQIFSSTEQITKAIFFDKKIIFRIINENRILILECEILVGTQIVTKYPLSHSYPNSHRFFGLTKMWLSGNSTVSNNNLLSINNLIKRDIYSYKKTPGKIAISKIYAVYNMLDVAQIEQNDVI